MSYRALGQVLVLIGLLGTLGCGKGGTGKSTILGGRNSSNDFSISDGNLITHPGKPGVLFGTTQVKGQSEQFSYLVVFKHAGKLADLNQTHSSNNSLNGKKGLSKFTLVQNGKTIQTNYEIGFDNAGKVASEELKIDDKVVDPKAGRLFLIDLSVPSPTYDQKHIKSLPEVKSLKSLNDVENVVNELLEALKSEIPQDFWK